MKRIFLFVFFITCFSAKAEVLDLNTALQNTYKACVDIDDSLYDMKVKAGINTAITAVGTATGAGAIATGFIKQKTDKTVENLETLLEQMEVLSDQYQGPNSTEEEKAAFLEDFQKSLDEPVTNVQDTQEHINELTAKSKKLGDWRTGLLAANTATNIAGATISGTNKVKKELEVQIEECKVAVKILKNSIIQAGLQGENVEEANTIAEACGEYEYLDLSSINKRATGAMVSSIVGATTGAVGTITSALANTDKTRTNNTEEGKKKEKDLNTASNVFSIGSTVASTTATVFNATQIAAIKKVAKVSEQCTGVLK